MGTARLQGGDREPIVGHAHDEVLDVAVCDDEDAPEAVSIAFEDRKSTRLNSSHLVTSYAVFCLKKKTHASRRRQSQIRQCQARTVQPAHARPIQKHWRLPRLRS